MSVDKIYDISDLYYCKAIQETIDNNRDFIRELKKDYDKNEKRIAGFEILNAMLFDLIQKVLREEKL